MMIFFVSLLAYTLGVPFSFGLVSTRWPEFDGKDQPPAILIAFFWPFVSLVYLFYRPLAGIYYLGQRVGKKNSIPTAKATIKTNEH